MYTYIYYIYNVGKTIINHSQFHDFYRWYAYHSQMAQMAHSTLESYGCRVVPPSCKRLACGDVGRGALAPVGDVVEAVKEACGGHWGGQNHGTHGMRIENHGKSGRKLRKNMEKWGLKRQRFGTVCNFV